MLSFLKTEREKCSNHDMLYLDQEKCKKKSFSMIPAQKRSRKELWSIGSKQ
jgi:hypothetical protein